jgi:hypothetical protein
MDGFFARRVIDVPQWDGEKWNAQAAAIRAPAITRPVFVENKQPRKIKPRAPSLHERAGEWVMRMAKNPKRPKSEAATINLLASSLCQRCRNPQERATALFVRLVFAMCAVRLSTAQSGHGRALGRDGSASHACTDRQLHGRRVASARIRAASALVIPAASMSWASFSRLVMLLRYCSQAV